MIRTLMIVIACVNLLACEAGADPCGVAVEKGGSAVKELALVPMRILVPDGWPASYVGPPDGESLSSSDASKTLSLRVNIESQAVDDSLFPSTHEKVGEAEIRFADGRVRDADRVMGSDGAGFRWIGELDGWVVEITALSATQGCDAELMSLLTHVELPPQS